MVFGALFIVLVAICLAAPLYADHVAHTTPYKNHLTDQIVVDGEKTDVVSLDGIPIGPTWQGEFFLGADTNGRDTAVRLLYGGRNSLLDRRRGRPDHDAPRRDRSACSPATSAASRTPSSRARWT